MKCFYEVKQGCWNSFPTEDSPEENKLSGNAKQMYPYKMEGLPEV